jgi:4a-hydroxytetrahydrobiopterin dehydratase
VRTFTLGNFVEAVEFVNEVTEIAEEANHHPDVDIRWNKVTLRLSTHSKGGLTRADFDLATRVDGLSL